MKTVIITGVSSGLGKAFFDLLAQEDMTIIAIGRRFLPYQTKMKRNKNVFLLKADLSKPINTLYKKLGLLLKNADTKLYFINNASLIEPIGEIGALEDKKIKDAIKVNFESSVLVINKLTNYCLQNNIKLEILHISTGASVYPIVGWPLYCSTKAAIEMFLQVLRQQLANNKNLAIYSIEPGVMNTKMQEQIRKYADKFSWGKDFISYKTNNQLKEPMEVASEIIKKYILK